MRHYPFSEPIPYLDPSIDFGSFAKEKGSFFLDSSLFHPKYGRYSFWGISPLKPPPLKSFEKLCRKLESLPLDPYFPFSGGLVGFLSYEWGAALENIRRGPETEGATLPENWFGLYDTLVGYDHLEQSCRVVSLGLNENLEYREDLARDRVENLIFKIRRARKEGISPRKVKNCSPVDLQFSASMERPQYIEAIKKILDYLRAGDCYQVNLSNRFVAPILRSPWEQYKILRDISPAPYSAFINGGDFQILSSSPELFLRASAEGNLMTRPIKGTRKREEDAEEDQKIARELESSAKDRAELLMITDLERNDLGKVSVPGSVKTTALREVESFAQVHHLVATIEGKKREDVDSVEILKALSPGGSITGAPKIRAMEIIRELEKVPRGLYTGSIGWIGPQNTAYFNIAIRTVVTQSGKAYFHSGGGIVIDSNPEAEYEEILSKAKGIMDALRK